MKRNAGMYQEDLYRDTDGDDTGTDTLGCDQRIFGLEQHNRSLQLLVCHLLIKNENLRSLLSEQ